MEEGRLRDESGLVGHAAAVAYPASAEELADIMRGAYTDGTAVTVQGGQTGLAGGAVPMGGLALNLQRMHRVLRAEGDTLLAEAGATLQQVDAEARRLGRFFAPNPTEDTATLGGVYATGAAGPGGLRHGAASRHIKRLLWCTPAGELWDIPRGNFVFDEGGCPLPDGTRLACRTDAACGFLPFGTPRPGLDLIDFLAGSEGRLGVAAQLEISLLPRPAALWGVLYFWRHQRDAESFVAWLEQSQVKTLQAAEFLDEAALQTIRDAKASHAPLKALPDMPPDATTALYVELAGDDPDALEEMLYAQLEQFVALGGREEDTWAVDGEAETRKLRNLTHALTELAGEAAAVAGHTRMETDFTGPPARFADYLAMYRQGMVQAWVPGFVYGHALQNGLRAVLLPQNDTQKAAARALVRKWAAQVAADGGLLVSEHGVGRLKQALVDEFLPQNCRAQRQAIKSFFDPKGML